MIRDFGDVLWSVRQVAAMAVLIGIAAVISIKLIGLAFERHDKRRQHARPTEQLPIGDLVVSPELERYAAVRASQPTEVLAVPCAEFCGDLGDVGEPRRCTCERPCGRPWCTRAREAARHG